MADQGVSEGLKWKHFYGGFVGAALDHNSPTKFCVLGVNPETSRGTQTRLPAESQPVSSSAGPSHPSAVLQYSLLTSSCISTF